MPLARIVTSAVRVLGNLGDPQYAFASDLLGGLVNDGVAAAEKDRLANEPPPDFDEGYAVTMPPRFAESAFADARTASGYFVPDAQHDEALRQVNAEWGVGAAPAADTAAPELDAEGQPIQHVVIIGQRLGEDYAARLAERAGGELGDLFRRGMAAAADVIHQGDIAPLQGAKADIRNYLLGVADRGGMSELEMMVFGALYAANEVLFPENVLDFAGGIGKGVGAAAGVIKLGGKVDELAAVVRVESTALAELKIAEANAAQAHQAARLNPALRGPEIVGKAEGPAGGAWGHPTQPRTADGADYAEQVTGVTRGVEYQLNGVWFDGYDATRNVLIDAKDWAGFVLPDEKFWVNDVLIPAQRQIDAAISTGASIEWRVSTREAADAIAATLQRAEIDSIRVIVVPKKGS